MAHDRGKEKKRVAERTRPAARGEQADTAGRLPALPDLVRKAFSLGFSGFFLTEEAIRRALGDTLPREWADFASEQSERTRREFTERLSFEIAQSLEKLDLASVMGELLEGRTLEVRAEIRLGAKHGERGPRRSAFAASLRPREEER
jgi:hypothetical protein